MEGQIAQLNERYGKNYDYQTLTEQQRAFLLNSEIKSNTDGCDWRKLK